MIYCVEMLSLVCVWFATVVRGMFDPRRNITSTVAIKSNISRRNSAKERCYTAIAIVRLQFDILADKIREIVEVKHHCVYALL